jgi:hypothetical protein
MEARVAAMRPAGTYHVATGVNPCPFCRRSDSLETLNWSQERYDGTEYIGEAVRCNRCDCIAPLEAWQGGTAAKP